MITGITLLFKDKNKKKIIGILKSTVLDITEETIDFAIEEYAEKIATEMNYQFMGINDIFSVSGMVKEYEILGRHTFYELDTMAKAKTLIQSKNYTYKANPSRTYFNFSSIYLCESLGDKYTISILSILSTSVESLIENVLKHSTNQNFIEKIKSNSLENIDNIEFVGIEDICEIDLKYNVFQTFYSSFKNEKSLIEEILNPKELKEIFADIQKQ